MRVTVIGAGIVGLFTAWELARAGVRVRVLDKGPVGEESSWAGGGLLCPLYPWQWPPAVQVLAELGRSRFGDIVRTLIKETGVDPEYRRTGLLVLDPAQRPEALRWAERARERVRILDGRQLTALEPTLAGRELEGALYLPDITQVRNPRLVAALSRRLRDLDVDLISHEPVTRLEVEAGRLTALHTQSGRWSADDGPVVLATGAWSGRLLTSWAPPLPVHPIRGEMLLLAGEPGRLRNVVVQGAAQARRYAIPRQDGHVLFGSTADDAGFDKTVSDSGRQALMSDLESMIPGLADMPVVDHWAGLRPGAPDDVPLVGPHPRIAGLHLNTGHFRNGILFAPVTARLVADQLLGRPPELNPEPYQLR